MANDNDSKTWKLLLEQALILPYLPISSCVNLLLFTTQKFSKFVQESNTIGKVLCEKRYPSSKLLIIEDYWLYLRGYPSRDYGRKFDDFDLLLVHGDSSKKPIELCWDSHSKAYKNGPGVFACLEDATNWWDHENSFELLVRNPKTREVLGRFQEIDDEEAEDHICFADGSIFLVPLQLHFVLRFDAENGAVLAAFKKAGTVAASSDENESYSGGDETAPIDANTMYLAFHDDSFQLSHNAYVLAVDIWGYFDAEHTIRREIFSGLLVADRRGKYFQAKRNFSRDFIPGEEVQIYGRTKMDVTIIRADGAILTSWRGGATKSWWHRVLFKGFHSCKEYVHNWFEYVFKFGEEDHNVFGFPSENTPRKLVIPNACKMNREVEYMRYDREDYPTMLTHFGADFFGCNWITSCQVKIGATLRPHCFQGVNSHGSSAQFRYPHEESPYVWDMRSPDDFSDSDEAEESGDDD